MFYKSVLVISSLLLAGCNMCFGSGPGGYEAEYSVKGSYSPPKSDFVYSVRLDLLDEDTEMVHAPYQLGRMAHFVTKAAADIHDIPIEVLQPCMANAAVIVVPRDEWHRFTPIDKAFVGMYSTNWCFGLGCADYAFVIKEEQYEHETVIDSIETITHEFTHHVNRCIAGDTDGNHSKQNTWFDNEGRDSVNGKAMHAEYHIWVWGEYEDEQ